MVVIMGGFLSGSGGCGLRLVGVEVDQFPESVDLGNRICLRGCDCTVLTADVVRGLRDLAEAANVHGDVRDDVADLGVGIAVDGVDLEAEVRVRDALAGVLFERFDSDLARVVAQVRSTRCEVSEVGGENGADVVDGEFHCDLQSVRVE